MRNDKTSIIRPPIQRVTLPHFLTRELVKQGIKRFHRITTYGGQDHLPKGEGPVIFISNHQNGLMDPMMVSGLLKQQLHWLTRADVFWNPLVRKYLLKCHGLPIYRQKDRLKDLRERNDVIWDCCIERLNIGAVLSLFPEGNHNPQKTIRGIKNGLGDLMGRAVSKYESLKSIKIIPLGLDYEDYPDYRRRFCLRMGKPIEWVDLYDKKTGKVHLKKLAERIQAAMRNIAVDISPYEKYDDIIPYVNALRTTEASAQGWNKITCDLNKISQLENVMDIADAAEKLRREGFDSGKMRVEAWGLSNGDVRKKKWWAVALKPLSLIANAPTFLQQLILNFKGDNVKSIAFRSTMKICAGMIVYPLTWTILAAILGLIASVRGFSFFGWSPFFEVFFTFWSFATFGNRFYGWLKGHLHDHNDAVEGERFWNDDKSTALREAWVNYIAVVKKTLLE